MPPINYLFFGFASEYVLHPFYHFMCQAGYCCIEIDLFETPQPRKILQSLKNKPTVLINSAHLFFDQANFSTSYQYEGAVVSVLEIIDYLKPIKSIYVPHDLSQLFHEKELPWLDLFDYLLLPKACPAPLRFHPQVINIGWIKRHTPVLPVTKEISRSIGFAFSEFEYHRRLGPEKTFEMWAPILTQNISVKLPHWQGSQLFENYLRTQGVNVFPSTASLSDFIDQHGVILCMGDSSVNAEAAYSGRKAINVLYNGYTEARQKHTLGLLPNIEYLTIEACAEFIQHIQEGEEYFKALTLPQIKPFDFEQAKKILTH